MYILKNKRNKMISIGLCITMVLMLAISFINNTLAQPNPITVVYENPTGYAEREVGVPFTIRGNGVTSWLSTDTTVATIGEVSSSGATVTGVRAGSAYIILSDGFGSVLTSRYQIFDPSNISQYTLTNGDEVYLNREGENALIELETVPIEAKDSILWTSRNPEVATVNTEGVITATTNKGSAIIIGDFTDTWGNRQSIVYLVVVDSTKADVLEDLIEYAKDLEDYYTPDSWIDSNIEQAIKDAQDVFNSSNPTEQEIEDAINNIKDAIEELIKRADNEDLRDILMIADDLEKDDYTLDSWETSRIEQIINEAKEVVSNSNATDEDIEKAINNIKDAIDQLIKRADNEDLKEILDIAKALEKEDYTLDSWEDSRIEQIIIEAEKVITNPNATDEDIEKAINDLYDALDKLEDRLNLVGLEDKLKDANNLIENEYTPGSWKDSDIEQVIIESETVLNNPDATEEEINNAINNLEDTMNTLIKRADKTGLASSIVTAGIQVQSKYTPASWEEMQQALIEANLVWIDQNVTQEVVDATKEALDKTIVNLKEEANKEALDMAIIIANSKEDTDYTESGWILVKDALAIANSVNNDPNAIQEDVDAAVANLEQALDTLVYIGELNKQIEIAENVDENLYTPSGWEAIREALEAAKEIQSNPNASQEEVDLVLSLLEDTKNEAQTVGDKGGLLALIQMAENRFKDDYTMDSWDLFWEAFEDAQNVAENKEATQQEINEARDALLHAMTNLQDRADKTILDALIVMVDNKEATDYSIGSWNNISDILAEAKTIDGDHNVSQEKVDTIINALDEAIQDLVYIRELAQTVAGASLIDTDTLTSSTQETFGSALENAIATLAKEDVTQAEVDDVLDKLEQALTEVERELASIIPNEVGRTFEDVNGVEWRVLVPDDGNGNALLITEHVYNASIQYNTSNTWTVFENSNLKNNTSNGMDAWYANAVGEDIKEIALTYAYPSGSQNGVEMAAPNNANWNPDADLEIARTIAGIQSEENNGKVFAFSVSEANHYKSDGSLNWIAYDATNKSRSIDWWLRSPANTALTATRITNLGNLQRSQPNTSSGDGSIRGFRAALWVSR